jgi:CheY-like chemotaxis protein/HPt (histidine-containing phosphotransfer) domain-containing protein
VDDSAQAREILYAMIEPLGWDGSVADTGEAALQEVRRAEDAGTPYDLVFMDWKMPGMDGLETASRIRQLRRRSSEAIIIIMVTAHGREVLSKQLKHDDTLLDGFLVKPVTASMLVDAVANVKRDAHRSSAPYRKQRLAGLKLLVVEDNLINQEVARELLRSEGASVDVANDGREGVDRLIADGANFDAVLMDLQMPVMDGYEATKAIRQLPNFQTMPIIATTANAMASDKEACRVAGMNDHVSKPINIDELVNAILRCCDNVAHGSHGSHDVPNDLSQSDNEQPGTDLKIESDEALKRLGGNVGLYAKLVARFKEDADQLIEQFKQHIEQHDPDKAMLAAHTLKGLAGTLGTTTLADYARDVEMALRNGQSPTDPAQDATKLTELTARSSEALNGIIARHRSTPG